MDAVQQAEAVILAVYAAPEAGKAVRTKTGAVLNQVAPPDTAAALLHEILRTAAEKTVVAAMGSPYVAAQFPEVQTYLCTFSNAQVSEFSAVKAMFGEIPMPGHLPITIPNIANRGAGVITPAPLSSGGPK